MLDQNTDRMWYVIGAVIIGAAIIFIMNTTFPQLFASIGETFSSKTEQVTKEVDNLTLTDGVGPVASNPNLIPASAQSKLWVTNVSVADAKLTFADGWTRIPLPTTAFEYGTDTYIDVKPNTEYTLSMTIKTDATEFDYLRMTFFYPDENGVVPIGFGHNIVETTATKVGKNLWRIVGTGYTRDVQTRMRVPDVFAEFIGGTYAEFGEYKLEEGVVATPFVTYK